MIKVTKGQMAKTIKFSSFEDRSWTGARKSIQRDLRSRGYNEELINSVIFSFESFWQEYAFRRGLIHIPEEKIQNVKYISELVNKHIYDLTTDMLYEIYKFCLLIKTLK